MKEFDKPTLGQRMRRHPVRTGLLIGAALGATLALLDWDSADIEGALVVVLFVAVIGAVSGLIVRHWLPAMTIAMLVSTSSDADGGGDGSGDGGGGG